MISLTIISYAKIRFKDNYKYYRIFYNLIAIGTFLPLLDFSKSFKSPLVFSFDNMMVFQITLVLVSLVFFIAGGKKYDMLHFIGLKQLSSGKTHSTLSADGKVNTSGILSITRHPWYLASFIFIWSYNTNIHLSTFILNSIFTAYLLIGVHLEERKLTIEFGDTYLRYKEKVSMIFPTKWILGKLYAYNK